MAPKLERPLPTQFTDYRAYLRAMFDYLKATRPEFSYRFFSRLAGFSSPNYLKLVTEGKRNLSSEAIGRFARGLGLDAAERDCFEVLVLLGQARTDEERNRYFSRLMPMQSKSAGPTVRLEHAQFTLFSSWYAPVVREMLLLSAFQEDPQWIGARLRPQVRAGEVKRALKVLEEVGLIERDQGRLKPSDTTISTGPRVRSLAVRNFHRAMLEIAAGNLDTIAVEERDFTALTVGLTRGQYDQVREKIAELRKEILALSERTAPDPETREIHHVGFQLFPVTRTKG